MIGRHWGRGCIFIGQKTDRFIGESALYSCSAPIPVFARSFDVQRKAVSDSDCQNCEVFQRREHADGQAPTAIAWIYEDTLPEQYPYDDMYPHSRVIDGVRMFPVFGPSADAKLPEFSPSPAPPL